MTQLTPTLRIDGKQYVMLTPQLAGISVRQLGQAIGNATAGRATIVAASPWPP